MLLIRRAGGDWHEPEVTSYDNEGSLQQLVKSSPTLLPGGANIAIVDEFTLPGVGSVDLVGVGPFGDITLVECKLRANPEIRKSVVGQVLAYAAGLWRLTFDEFEATFTRRAGMSLTKAVSQLPQSSLDEGALRTEVTRHLQEGDFRLVIAVDEITSQLKMIIEYLNEHTVTAMQVLAVELGYSQEGDVELLVPAVYGEELASRKGRSATTGQWTPVSFTDAMEQRTSGAVRTFVDRLLKHGTENGNAPYYGIGKEPTLSFTYDMGGHLRSLWALVLREGAPYVGINFGSVDDWSHDRAVCFLRNLTADPLLASALQSIEETNLNKYPNIAVEPSLTDAQAQSVFFSALDELLK